MGTDIEVETKLVPCLEIRVADSDQELWEIERYLRKTECVSMIGTRYSFHLSDNIDKLATLVKTSERRRDGIDEVRNLLERVQHVGGNFLKVYAEIVFIAHLLLVLNRELRGKHKKISKMVEQAISLYEEVDKDSAEIFWVYRDSIQDFQFARWTGLTCFVIIIVLIMCLSIVSILLGASY